VREMKQLPHNMEAEESILGAIFLKPDAINRITDILRSRDFYKPAHKIIFEAMIMTIEKGEVVDPLIIINQLEKEGKLSDIGGQESIFRFMDIVPTAANIEYYAKIVKEKSILRGLIDAGTSIIEEAYDSQEDVDQILDKAENTIFKIAQNRDKKDVTLLRDLIDSELQRLQEVFANKGEVTGIGTGFSEFDKKTSGFHPANLVIIAARPAMGKTAFALNVALNAAQKYKKNVLLFSLEMANEEIFHRLLSADARIPLQKIKKGFMDPEEWQKVGISTGRLAETPLYIADTPNVSVMEIRTICRRLKAENKLDMVVIDYIGLIRGRNSNSDNRQQEMSEISRGLKLLARELGIPIIALSQLSRGVESRNDKRPMLSDLRDSGAIEQDADLVVFLYRDEYYHPESEHKGLAEAIIAKQRNGSTGTTFLRFFGEYTKFTDYTPREE